MTKSKVLATVKFHDVSKAPEFTVEVSSMNALGEALDKGLEALTASTFNVLVGPGMFEVTKMEKVFA